MTGGTNAGGGERLQAAVGVTYPEGSVCTITNGDKTYTARDTVGNALFNVPAGEWTVSCTNGEHTASKSITAEEYSAVTVVLYYELILFDAGTYADETGGWTGISSGALVLSGENKKFSTNEAIDMSMFNTLYMEVTKSYHAGFGIGSSKASYGVADKYSNASTGKQSLDISKYNDSYYVTGYTLTTGNDTPSFKVTKVWLSQ
jgi:hypothetical protein